MSQASNTPAAVSITPRNPSFEIEAQLATDWVDGDAFLTAVFNAMSLSFPTGEKAFIDSVRAFEDQITNEKLLDDVRNFYRQEGAHSREHRRYNRLLCRQRGYDLDELESIFIRRVEAGKHHPRVSAKVRLAMTVGVEHFTATFGENVLEGRLLRGVDGAIGDLWRWHCMEELEHKSVAFDVFTHIGGTPERRTKVMRLAMWFTFKDTLRVALRMLRQDGQLFRWKTLKSAAKFFLARNGFLRLHMAAYRDYFRPNFHPWDTDNSALLTRSRAALEPKLA